MRKIIQTEEAPQAIGIYSQAIQFGHTVYFSGQIGLDPKTMILLEGIEAQAHQIFKNLLAVAKAGKVENNHFVKINIFLVDLANFSLVNTIMAEYFSAPYPARAVVGVAQLPRGALIEADAIAIIDQ